MRWIAAERRSWRNLTPRRSGASFFVQVVSRHVASSRLSLPGQYIHRHGESRNGRRVDRVREPLRDTSTDIPRISSLPDIPPIMLPSLCLITVETTPNIPWISHGYLPPTLCTYSFRCVYNNHNYSQYPTDICSQHVASIPLAVLNANHQDIVFQILFGKNRNGNSHQVTTSSTAN
ncbi:hypothetical protein P153DRAFT_160779 [Dothidotthia symphoricarpi CBS 119687]|uniref:Uncharacterized protein n=1 Tax=Dothidotthia symphoricarpi CBS 119687 TaxID=1392245 RepID=A0A6A6AST6_9PLEO|nr:uncharacterized protein P153DRAFT_160779 [Dothidotthia symphoricarpi CBS 119687]KAF2133611.1 hypothetical protein P153DRAFT_160779 [Dothidotthia symphoricarpi CBS 119687]